MFDLVIKNATIIDGTGRPGFLSDLAVENDYIASIDIIPENAAPECVDAKGMVLAPGFIDIHTHADIALLARPDHLPKTMQGVTTEVFTNCGLGFAPVTPEGLEIQKEFLSGVFGDDEGVDWGWKTVGQFLSRYENQGTGTNVAYLMPHGSVRVSVMGMDARPAISNEIERMVSMVEQGMEEGAWGLSTGLFYAPMCHADRAETVAICKAAGFFATHQRDYRENLDNSTLETIEIAREAGVPVQLSHLQLNGPENHGRSPEILQMLDRARSSGVDIMWDSYPYCAGSTLVQAMLPAWVTDGGPKKTLDRLHDPNTSSQIVKEMTSSSVDWTKTVLAGARSSTNNRYEGLKFSVIAEKRGLSPAEFMVKLLLEDELQACFISHQQNEPDVTEILKHPAQMVGSDGLHLPGKTHPRLYGTFPRVLGHYVREREAISLEQAIWKMSGAPAARLGLKNRGTIETGKAADLVLFDPQTVSDVATYEDPLRFPKGITHVLVNGRAVKWNDQPTHDLPGRVLRRQSSH